MQPRRSYKAPHHTRDEIAAGLELARELVDEAGFLGAERAALLPVTFNHVMAAHIGYEQVAPDAFSVLKGAR